MLTDASEQDAQLFAAGQTAQHVPDERVLVAGQLLLGRVVVIGIFPARIMYTIAVHRSRDE